MKKLLSLILAVAMCLALFTGVTASALTVTNQIFVNGEEGALASGNIDVTVQHDELATAATVFGAIYENDRLFAIKSNVAGTNSTDLAFGDLTLDSAKTYTFKSFILSDAETLAIAEAKGSAAVETIYVQAEEFATYTKQDGTVLTSMALADGFDAGDANYGEAKPSDVSGNGVAINQYSTTYTIVWRGPAAQAGKQFATYTANVPAAGKYEVVINWKKLSNRDVKVVVGDQEYTVTGTGYDDAAYTDTSFGEFDFVAGDNTIAFYNMHASAATYIVDYIKLVPVTTEPVVGPTAEAAADLWYNNAGVAEIVKVWNCTAPAGTTSVALTFNTEAAKTVDLTPIAGDATAAFQVLLFNTNGAAVTLDIQ